MTIDAGPSVRARWLTLIDALPDHRRPGPTVPPGAFPRDGAGRLLGGGSRPEWWRGDPPGGLALRRSERATAHALAELLPDGVGCPGLVRVAQAAGCSLGRVGLALARFERHGLIVRDHRHGGVHGMDRFELVLPDDGEITDQGRKTG